jgi:hypothetical protein
MLRGTLLDAQRMREVDLKIGLSFISGVRG